MISSQTKYFQYHYNNQFTNKPFMQHIEKHNTISNTSEDHIYLSEY